MGSRFEPRKVLVVRNDKVGDFTLALPSFDLLKKNMPEIELWALVPEYTRALAGLHAAIDHVLVDPGNGDRAGSAPALAGRLRKERFDAVITLFSTTRVGAAVWLAGIPCRIAPATKIAQGFYNWRVKQRRSHSVKPEFEYNLDLIRAFLTRHGRCVQDQIERPVLRMDSATRARRREAFATSHDIRRDAQWIFVHPGHGGSARNLSQPQYQHLVEKLYLDDRHALIVTAGPGESEAARRLAESASCPAKAVHHSEQGLADFVEVLATADVFISGSTGPLHIAGALDVPTAAFYPRRATSSATRWQTLNGPERRLAFMPPAHAHERDMSAIDIDGAAELIRRHYLETTDAMAI